MMFYTCTLKFFGWMCTKFVFFFSFVWSYSCKNTYLVTDLLANRAYPIAAIFIICMHVCVCVRGRCSLLLCIASHRIAVFLPHTFLSLSLSLSAKPYRSNELV